MPRLLDDSVLDDFNQRLGVNGATCKRLGINGDGLGRLGVMSGGRTVLQVACGEGRNLLLQCCKVGLVLKQEYLAISVGVGKIGHIGSGTGMVDTGVGKCCFLIVKGLHSVGKERA